MTQPTKLPRPSNLHISSLNCSLLIVQLHHLCKVSIVVLRKNYDPPSPQQKFSERLNSNIYARHQVCQSTRMAFDCHLQPLHSSHQHDPATLLRWVLSSNQCNFAHLRTDKVKNHIKSQKSRFCPSHKKPFA